MSCSVRAAKLGTPFVELRCAAPPLVLPLDACFGRLHQSRLLTDTLAKTPKKAVVEGVDEKKVYSDGTRTVEMYHIYPAPHSNGLMVAYIPKEKVLFQGDFSLPAEGQPANDHIKALVPALEKLKVTDFERYINVHAPATPQTKADLWKAVGK